MIFKNKNLRVIFRSITLFPLAAVRTNIKILRKSPTPTQKTKTAVEKGPSNSTMAYALLAKLTLEIYTHVTQRNLYLIKSPLDGLFEEDKLKNESFSDQERT